MQQDAKLTRLVLKIFSYVVKLNQFAYLRIYKVTTRQRGTFICDEAKFVKPGTEL